MLPATTIAAPHRTPLDASVRILRAAISCPDTGTGAPRSGSPILPLLVLDLLLIIGLVLRG